MNCIERLKTRVGSGREAGDLLGMGKWGKQRVCALSKGYGGREPTGQHDAHVLAIELIIDSGLLDDLRQRMIAAGMIET
ncbi:MAG: hypothetical protein KKC18_08085 [Chloroflexi bacterium]|nr:hypothetical protein [Chloroflexota bacterium]